ncbi:MAG: hypothetical protein K2M20_03260 [Lachnospiraceae bacterium]|nr:hypothetical protein [Lachnospiraceae bacterium]MDE6601931.1 hypothetical protein [Lachnospiraceae bacterium]
MAMEISVKGSTYKTDYADRLQAEREEVKKAGNAQKEEKTSNQKPVQQDAYISSEKSGEKPNGLYHVGQDENGNKKVYFNDPKKAKGNEQPEEKGGRQPKVNGEDPDRGEEKCVGNTDKVDREIRELKEKKKKLEQQIKQASGDEKKTKELENKLAQVERELSQKDTDTYRKQNSTFTEE